MGEQAIQLVAYQNIPVNREIEFDDMGPGRTHDILLIRRLTALSTDHIASPR